MRNALLIGLLIEAAVASPAFAQARPLPPSAVAIPTDAVISPPATVATPVNPTVNPGVLVADPGNATMNWRTLRKDTARLRAESAVVDSGTTLPASVRPVGCDAAISGHPSESAQSSAARFGEVGGHRGAYVEEHFADGYVVYTFKGGILVAPSGRAPVFCPFMVTMSQTPFGTPPSLPDDPQSGAQWVQHHNDQLLEIIRKQVANDAATMSAIAADEAATTGGDLFRQTDYLTGIADFYAANAP